MSRLCEGSSWSVVRALVHRNLLVIGTSYRDSLINSSVIACVDSFILGYLLPMVGISGVVPAAMFLGTVLFNCMIVAHVRVTGIVYDLQGTQFTHSLLTTPVSLAGFVFAQILSLAIELANISLPVLLLGKLILGDVLNFAHAQWPMAVLVYVVALAMFSALQHCMAFGLSFETNMQSAFSRILIPIAFLGCFNTPWGRIAQFFPTLKYLFLISPFTYAIEGLRGTLLGYATIPAPYCILVMTGYLALFAWGAHRALIKRHDILADYKPSGDAQ